jgi:hypothetical protein
MKIEVNVAEEIIATSQGGCFDCPLAKGLQAAGYPEAKVYMELFTLDGDYMHTHRLPSDAETFQRDYDAGIPVSPATFVLEVGEAWCPRLIYEGNL